MISAAFALHRSSTAPFAALRAGLAVAAAATVLAATPAHAQWGKIRDIGKAAAKGAAGDKVDGAAKRAVSGPEGTPARAGRVTFSENLLEITGDRLTAFLRGFDAEIAARPEADRAFRADMAAFEAAGRAHAAKEAAYERDYAAYEKRKAAQTSCVDAVQAKHEPSMQREQEAAAGTRERVESSMDEAREKRMQALAKRMQAAQAKNDRAAMAAISDSVQRELAGLMSAARESQAGTNRMMARGKAMEDEMKKCPQAGVEPTRPDAPQSAGRERAERIVDDAAAKASGFTAAQYRLMLERVETYVKLKGRTGSTQYVFTAAELEALAAQLAELQKRPGLVEPTYWYPGMEERS